MDIIERVFSPMAETSHGSEHTGYDMLKTIKRSSSRYLETLG